MASATTNLLRDLGFVLGPVVVGAVALSSAGGALGAALPTAGLPADQAAAAEGVLREGGPLALNGLPPAAPGAAAHDLALAALGGGFTLAFGVCAAAALIAALLTLVGMAGMRDGRPFEESLHDPAHPEPAGTPTRPAAGSTS
jgi:hypothetical protein